MGSLLAVAALAVIGRQLFAVPPAFDKFNVGSYAPLTVGGILGAVLAWALVVRVSAVPVWLLGRLAVVVTVVLLVPDLLLLPQQDNPVGPVATLMVMHIAIALVTYAALTRVARWRPAGD